MQKSFSSSYLPTHVLVKHTITDYWHDHLQLMLQLSEAHAPFSAGEASPPLQLHASQDANRCILQFEPRKA